MMKKGCERLKMNTLTAATTTKKSDTYALPQCMNAFLNYSDRNVMKAKYRSLSTLEIKMEHPVH